MGGCQDSSPNNGHQATFSIPATDLRLCGHPELLIQALHFVLRHFPGCQFLVKLTLDGWHLQLQVPLTATDVIFDICNGFQSSFSGTQFRLCLNEKKRRNSEKDCREDQMQTHHHLEKWWHIYASEKWVIIGSGNGLAPVGPHAITWTNADLSAIVRHESDNNQVNSASIILTQKRRFETPKYPRQPRDQHTAPNSKYWVLPHQIEVIFVPTHKKSKKKIIKNSSTW